MVKDLFQIQREFILCSTGFNYGENSDCGIRYLASPVGSGPAQAAKMREIKTFASRHAYSPHAPHLHFVADTIGSVGWIVAGDRPSHFIRESYDGGKHHVKHIPGIEKTEKEKKNKPQPVVPLKPRSMGSSTFGSFQISNTY